MTSDKHIRRLIGASKKGFALLERGTTGVTDVFVEPTACFVLRDGNLTRDGKTISSPKPLETLEKELRGSRGKHVVGYLGYDCAKYLEELTLPASAATEPDACFLVFESKLSLKNDVSAGKTPPRKAEKTAPPTPKFKEQITRIRSHIKEGDIFQCVISERFETAFSGDSVGLYFTLRALNPSPYHYLLQLPEFAIVGASPEPLIKVKNSIIETHPIAGTRPRGKTAAEDKRLEGQLKRSQKEQAEHLMLVDLSRNDLGRVCEPGSVYVKSFQRVERFSHVMHLVSTVEGKLRKSYSAFQALFACFPAGTLTGAPKVRAMQIISQLETERRGAYGGAMVFSDDSRFDSCITIRSAVLAKGRAFFQAGAGIVADSQAGREYTEIRNKSASMRRALELSAKESS